jgi:hypothetical protein
VRIQRGGNGHFTVNQDAGQNQARVKASASQGIDTTPCGGKRAIPVHRKMSSTTQEKTAMTIFAKIRRLLGITLTMTFFSAFTLARADGPVIDDVNADIYGRWKIAKVLDYADITALSERQAKKLIGKTVVVARDKLVFNGKECDAPSYERTVEDTARSMREQGHVSSVNMGLPDQMTVIDAGCTTLFLKSNNRIVIHWDGFYFDAIKRKH